MLSSRWDAGVSDEQAPALLFSLLVGGPRTAAGAATPNSSAQLVQVKDSQETESLALSSLQSN